MNTATFLIILAAIGAQGELIEILNFGCKTFNPGREKEYNDTVTADKIQVHFYTGGRYYAYPLLNASQSLIANPAFNLGYSVVVYSHGFKGNATSESNTALAKAFATRGFTNYVTMDYGEYYRGEDYVYTAGSVPKVANMLFQFVSELYQKGVALPNIYLIGESLGAQTSSLAAKKFKATYNLKLRKITALDPAAPCFSGVGLSPDDADYVEVVFTSYLATTSSTLGHAQYFVNNVFGMQPGCSTFPLPDILCSHMRAKALFAEAVLSPFVAKKCTSVADKCDNQTTTMMSPVNTQASGNYFFKTNSTSPFNLGLAGIN